MNKKTNKELNDFQRMQLLIQLKVLKCEMMRTFKDKSEYRINKMMRDDISISDIMNKCGVLYV